MVSLSKRERYVLGYLASIPVITFLLAVGYWAGMLHLEHRPVSLGHSLMVVAESMTTTGYGSDAPWTTTTMQLYVILLQIMGIIIGLVGLRVVIIPLFERTTININDNLDPVSDHVIICEYNRDIEVLLDEFDRLDQEYVFVVSDKEKARDLFDEGYPVLHGDAEDTSVVNNRGRGGPRLY